MNVIQEIRSHPSQTLKTLILCLCFVSFGLIGASFGPVLLDFKIQVGTSLENITLIFPIRSFGSVVGCVICGFVLRHVDSQWITGIALTGQVCTFFSTTFCRTLTSLLGAMFANGVFSGFLLNAGNMWTLHMWGKQVGPFMQAVHFAFGLGAFFSPLIVEPYLLPQQANVVVDSVGPEPVESNRSIATFVRFMSPNLPANLSDTSSTSYTPEDVHFASAFQIIFSIICAFLAMYLFVVFWYPANPMHPSRAENMEENKKAPKKSLTQTSSSLDVVGSDEAIVQTKDPLNKRPCPKWMAAILILFAALFIHAIYGVELSFGSLLTPFAVNCGVHLSTSRASLLTSFYWGCFAFLRLGTVLLSPWLSSVHLLFASCTILMIGNLIMLPLANTAEWALWVGTGLIGAGVCSVYACLYTFLEQNILVTGGVTSILTLAACIGEFVLPIFIGYFIEQHPMYYLYIIFIYGSIAFMLLCMCYIWSRRIQAYRTTK